MASFPTWIVDAFYHRPRPALREAIQNFLSVVNGPTVFAADNLITFGKSLKFLQDQRFALPFTHVAKSDAERALVWRKHVLHWAAQMALSVDGDFVEAACYEGNTARFICDAVGFSTLPRKYWLCDLFEGLPDSSDPAQPLQKLSGHTPDLFARVTALFSDTHNVRIMKGELPGSLALDGPERVALIHLDMNDAPGEIKTLELLYPRLSVGGIIVLDDYGWATYSAQTDAHFAWFSERGQPILELPTGQGLVIKRAV